MAFSSPNPFFAFRVPKPSSYSAYKSSTTLVCSDPACSSSLYDVLGVPATATSREIKAAYRKLARVSHPDVAAARMNENQKGSSGEEFVRVNAAYATLSDAGKRADYDREVCVRRLSIKAVPLSSEPRLGSRTCRNWETDQCW